VQASPYIVRRRSALSDPGAQKLRVALIGSSLDDAALDKAASAITQDVGGNAMGDIYASSDYRTAMVGVY